MDETRKKAIQITEMFDEFLIENGIRLPSGEDEERDPDNEAALYGMIFWNLVSDVEELLRV